MADPSDPWDWDTDRIVQEFCTENQSWNPPSYPPRLPDLKRLEASLRENEVDGEVLLGKASSEVDFFPDLGIKAIKHKETVRSAITQFRRRSKKYKIFKVRQDQEEDEGEDGELSGELDEATRRKRLEDERRADDNGVIPHNSVRALSSAAMVPSPELGGLDPTTSAAAPARKKRRIAPITISTDVDVNSIRTIPTEADVILNRLGLGNISSELKEGQASIEKPAYLWENPLPRVELVEFDVTDQLLTQQDQELEIFESRPPPYRRRRQVGHLLKRRLLRRDPVFRPAKADMIPGGDNPDHNLILPPMGESDGEEEYDSETWAEVQKEQAEEQKAGAKITALNTDEKHSMVDEIMAEYRSAWEERKLPRLERKANHIWNNARRHGLKRAMVKEQKDLDIYDKRLAKYRENIVNQEWRDKAEIRKTAGVFEATIQDRQLSFWMLELLKSPTEPRKLPRGPRKVHLRSSRSLPQGEEEILTSESEDGLDNFIVQDEMQEHCGVISEAGHDEIIGDMEDADGDITMKGVDTVNGEVSAPREPLPNEERYHGKPVIGAVDEQSGNNGGSMNTETSSGKVSNIADKGTSLDGHGVETVDDEAELLDLTLPQAPKEKSPKKAIITLTPRRPKNPVLIDLVNSENGILDQPSSQQSVRSPGSQRSVHMVVELSPQFLETLGHNQRLVEKELLKLDDSYRGPIFHFARHWPVEDLWKDFILPALDAGTIPKPPFKRNESKEKDRYIASLVMRLFDIFTSGKSLSIQQFRLLFDEQKQAIKEKGDRFPEFVLFIRTLSAEYKKRRKSAKKHSLTLTGPPSSQSEQQDKELRNPDNIEEHDDISDEIDQPPSNKKRKPTIVRDRAAASLREGDRRRAEEQEQRKKMMRARLAISGSSASQKSHLIINESKEDDQGFIYVPDRIAACIKKHQVEGVRFLWNQIVMDSQVRQGCLLAHTMGLGKTMQIITLLMVIVDAAASDDESISGQIPEDLKESRTLILVPSGLVNNWIEELLNWTSIGHGLGDFFKLHADLSPVERIEIIRDWSNDGGVLVMGYDLFKGFVDKDASISEDLLNKPNIVVADEAHMLKNPNSQLHKATANFRTHSRIALTGSPLANNVLEYHSMINWVAPNYLSDLREFRQDYANPIEAGLSVDSTPSDRRRALTKLQVLKKTVAPKVHRRTIAVLKEDIPAKMEFVIHVPLTDIQRQAYETYMTFHSTHSSPATSARGFATLNILALLCNHPACFRTRLVEAKNKKGAATDEVTGNAALPPQLVSEELQLLPNEDIDTEIYSWKIPLLNQILDESAKQGDRVLIFSQSIPTLNYLEKIFRRRKRHFLRLDGATPINRRQNMVKDFNQNQFDVFLISTNAGGLGLNIVGANRVVIFDFKYNPQNEQQAVGRAYRLGQEKPVFVYRLVCGGTFEEKMQNKGVFKMQLASRVVDKKNPIPKAQRFEELFAMPTDPEQQELRPFRGKDQVLDSILNSDLRLGVRSIVEADTFEEEDLEEQQLTAEEELEAQRLIDEHHARLAGKPIPHRQDDHSALMVNELGATLATEHQASLLGNNCVGDLSSQMSAQGNVAFASNNSVGFTSQAHNDALPAPVAPPVSNIIAPPQAPFPLPSQNGLVHPNPSTALQASYYPSTQDSTVQPVLGVSTQVRQSPANFTSRRPLEELRYWDEKPQAFKGELGRIFTSFDSVHSVKEKRRQTAQKIDTAFSEQAPLRNSDGLNEARWAVMEAAKSQRFIEAVVVGCLRPDELAAMDAGAITSQCQLWDQMTDERWNEFILSQYFTGDSEKQRVTLPVVDATPNGEGSYSNQSEPQQPSRQISHKDADQAALQELKARREARSKEPRLPVWAKEAVKTKGKARASSSTSPGSPSTNPKHTARNPFR